MQTSWTADEIRILRDTTKTKREVSSLIGRTRNAITAKSRKLGIKRKRERDDMSVTNVMDNDTVAKLRNREVFTNGEAAIIFAVAPRTMAKWIDKGTIEGYRVPGGRDRRVLREKLVEFAFRTNNHIAMKRLAPPIVLVGVDEQTKAAIVSDNPGCEIRTCATGFMAGTVLSTLYSCVVVDSVAVGLNCARQIAIMCGPRAVVLLTEDISTAEVAEWEQEKTGAKLLRKPCDIRTVVAAAKEVRL